MASTERSDEQTPAIESSATPSAPFPNDLDGLTAEPVLVPGLSDHANGDREQRPEQDAAMAADPVPAAAMPVRRARRVLLADPLPEPGADIGSPRPADPVLGGDISPPLLADPVLGRDIAPPLPADPPPGGDIAPPLPADTLPETTTTEEPAAANTVNGNGAGIQGEQMGPPLPAGPAPDGHMGLQLPGEMGRAEAPAAVEARGAAGSAARPAATGWLPSAPSPRGRRGATNGSGRATGAEAIPGSAHPAAPGATLAVTRAIPVPGAGWRPGTPARPAQRGRPRPPPGAPRPDPDAILEAEADASPARAATGLRAALGRSAIWRSRALLLGGLGLGLALYGQQEVTVNHAIIPGIRWYAAAIVLMILAWLGTYKNKSYLGSPLGQPVRASNTLPVRALAHGERAAPRRRFAPWRAFSTRRPRVAMGLRYVLALAAVGLNLYSVNQLRTHGYDSAIGGYGWFISLVLLLIAFLGHRPTPHPSADALVDDVEDRTDIHIDRRLEILIFLAIFALGAWLRLNRLDDWTTGMHGDEGEAGMDAISILEGHPVSPFLTGWFSQPNFYYWGIALTMKVFGTGLFGLRMFSTLAGTLMLIPFYPLVRQWFGVRTAIIATFLLAISDVAIHFSKQEFSNITTPLFLVTGFFFFFRGLRDRKLINFVLAGYAHILSMYFYLGGRLTPILVVAFLAYLFLLMPLVRLPGVYGQLRKRLPKLPRTRALGRALRFQARGVWLYAAQIIVYTLACICFISPWLAYFVDHQEEWNARANDKLILNNPQNMVQQHGATHTPLYLGLRAPVGNDILPLPVVFEQTPLSIRLLPLPWETPARPNPNPLFQDGFWARAVWGQLTTTLSILTYRGDASSVYTFALAPVAKPIEAVLIILGIAWALWRWRDTRMMLLSLWFWSTVLVGGVLTIDAPYMARLVGIIPTLAVFAAIPLNKLVAEFVHVVGRWGRSIRLTRTSQAFSGLTVFALLVFLGRQNYIDYFDNYLQQVPAPFAEVTGQAYFVRQMNQQLAAQGRPTAKFYDLGAHLIYWGHGDNRFLNHGVEGIDMVNASNELPVIENGPQYDRDVVFMVWGLNQQYLAALHAYYPDGIEQPFYYPDQQHGSLLFTSYRVPKEQLEARRMLTATYSPAHGPAITRAEPNLGTGNQPLTDVAYPVQARWTGNLVAPAFGRYRLHYDGPSDGRLRIDGTAVLTGTTGPAAADAEIILARGPHDVELTGTLAGQDTSIRVQWAIGSQIMGAIPRQFLWTGPGKALLGDIRPLVGDAFGPWPADNPAGGATPALLRRVDGFLGFRDAPNALSNGAGLMGRWTGTLNITQAGSYQFSVFSNGDSTIAIDGQTVVNNRQGGASAHEGNGDVTLTPGAHALELRYSWMGNVGYLEVYWTPPGGQRTLLGPANLQADGGAWAPNTISDPGNVNVQLGVEPPVLPADAILDTREDLLQPRGLAVDSKGTLYVADTGHHRVVVVDKAGKVTGTWGQEGKGPGEFAAPEDVGIGLDGLVYVLDSSLNRVEVFTPDGKFQRSIGEGSLSTSAGLTVGPDGLIYVADVTANRVRSYTPAGEAKKEYTGGTDPGTSLSQPVDVAVGKDGLLYVADLRNRIVQIDPATDTIKKTWPLQIGTSLGAANLALFGKLLYVTDPDRNHLDVLNVATGQIDQYGQGGTGSGQFGEPLGVDVGTDGKIYVVDSDHGRIEIFNKLVPTK